jgi:hypothetical protein
MTHEEWLTCNDARLMLEALWTKFDGNESILVPRLHRYFVANCRVLWNLLPNPESRRCVELTERELNGETINEFLDAEGASFAFDFNIPPSDVRRWVAKVKKEHFDELLSYTNRSDRFARLTIRETLAYIAYFVEFAINYPWIVPKPNSWRNYTMLLSADLLRQHFDNPFFE